MLSIHVVLFPACFFLKSKYQSQTLLAELLKSPMILFQETPALRPKRISSDEKTCNYHLLFPFRKSFSSSLPPLSLPPPLFPPPGKHILIILPSERPHQVTGVLTSGSNKAEIHDWWAPGWALTRPDALPLFKLQCEAE